MMCMAGLAAAMLQPACVNAQNSEGPAQEVLPCPADLDSIATCHAGRDANGAWLLTAIPKQWNHILVVHAHGGPRLGVPKSDDGEEDLERFAAMVRQGYAWTGSTYRRGGYGVRMAAADVDESRKLFWQQFGKPQLTILHGQSYGGNVAAKLAELGTTDATGNRLYDGVLLTNGVLWGGTKAYGFRADLRAVYQYFCRNHPRPDEPQYPLWQGLASESQMTRAELERRVNDCTGVNLPKDQRSAEQDFDVVEAVRHENTDAITGFHAKREQRPGGCARLPCRRRSVPRCCPTCPRWPRPPTCLASRWRTGTG